MKLFLSILGGLALLLLILFLPLRAESQISSMTRTWTAPGDDGNVGTASTYEMRWSKIRPDTTSIASLDSWWNSATIVTPMPNPSISGTPQSVVVTPTGGFPAGETIYFLMRACDEVPNCSSYSNIRVVAVPDTTPPSRIIDLF